MKNKKTALELIDKEIDILSSRIMFNETITNENLNDHFIIHNAFTSWSSHIQIRNIVIRQISSNPVSRRYLPEFQL